MSAFHQKLLADLAGDGEKMLAEAAEFARRRYGVDLLDLDANEKLMVVLAAQKTAEAIAA